MKFVDPTKPYRNSGGMGHPQISCTLHIYRRKGRRYSVLPPTRQGNEKAVQIRHYPVTVSAENPARTIKATGTESWEGSQGLLTRKSGERPCFTNPRGYAHVRSYLFCGASVDPLFFCLYCWRRSPAFGAESGTLRGTVTDPLGAVIVSATVELLDGTSVAAKTTTDASRQLSLPSAEIRSLPGSSRRAHLPVHHQQRGFRYGLGQSRRWISPWPPRR